MRLKKEVRLSSSSYTQEVVSDDEDRAEDTGSDTRDVPEDQVCGGHAPHVPGEADYEAAVQVAHVCGVRDL